jgi:small-conductance mechanosensitive channel
MAGVDRLADSAVIVRCRFEVKPLEQWNVKREFLRRVKKAFDTEGIEIPFPHVTIYAGHPKQGRAPAFHVTEDRDPAIIRAPRPTATSAGEDGGARHPEPAVG